MPIRTPLAALVVTLLPLAAAAQSYALRVPPVTCVPGDVSTMQNENKPITAGTVTKEGRTTPPRVYFCPITNPNLAAPVLQFTHMQMTYADNTSSKGNARLRLFAKSMAQQPGDPTLGTTFVIATLNSLPGLGILQVSTPLTTVLDFSRFTYWWVLDLKSPATGTSVKIDVHDLALLVD